MKQSQFSRIATLLLTLIFAISILTVVFSSLRGELLQLGAEDTFVNNLGVFIFVNINLIIALVLVFLVVKNVIKLLLDRRRGILGSRLRTRLVGAFVALSLIPTVLLFIVARGIIESVLQGWFSPQITTVVDGALDVADFYYKSADQRLSRELDNVADHLQAVYPIIVQDAALLGEKELALLDELLERKRTEYGLFELVLVDENGKTISRASSIDAQQKVIEAPQPSLGGIRNALRGKNSVRAEQSMSGEFIRGYAGLGAETSSVVLSSTSKFLADQNQQKVAPYKTYGLVATEWVSPELSKLLASVLSAYDDYKELRMFRQPIVSGYILTLVVVMLFIIFGAIWVGLYLAKSWSIPIAELAAGTKQIAGGNLRYRIPEVGDDELSILVQSFNKMTADLADTTDELVRRRQHMEAVLANVGVGVIALDDQDQVTTFNRAARNILSVPNDLGLQGKQLRDILPVELASDIADLISSLRHSSERVVVDTFSTTIAGEARHLHLTLTQLRSSEAGQVIGNVLLLDDVTALVSAQRMAAWREVARRIAHEIKNPLTPIQLCAQRMQKRFADVKDHHPLSSDDIGVIKESTGLIVKQVESLRTLVNEFSRFARMPKSQLHEASMNTLVLDTVEMVKQAHHNIKFVVELDKALPAIDMDEEQMGRVLVNIIDNAIASIESSDTKDGEIIINTNFDKELEIVQLTIADNGIGIAEEDKPRVFEPYFSTKKQGTGLGLAIVSTIIADHHGYVRLRDNAPRGAMFIIEFPSSTRSAEKAEEKSITKGNRSRDY